MEACSSVGRGENTGDSELWITSMESAVPEQWQWLGEIQSQVSKADQVLRVLLQLDQVTLGFPVSQLVHGLQIATRAERAGADPEMIVGALCHDIGRVLPGSDHALLSAALLRPHVRPEVYQVIRAHWAFQLRYTHQYIPNTRADQRARYRRKPWYHLAECFADDWDQRSFDPAYDTLPLEHFEPMVREVFDRPPSLSAPSWKSAARAGAGHIRDWIGV